MVREIPSLSIAESNMPNLPVMVLPMLIEEEEEWLCILKSRYDRYEKLEERIKSIHPYEEPEILALSVVKGSQSYLKWLDLQLSSGSEKGGVE